MYKPSFYFFRRKASRDMNDNVETVQMSTSEEEAVATEAKNILF